MGGETSSDKEWPWATQLLRYNELICGATLIASNWLLTGSFKPFETILNQLLPVQSCLNNFKLYINCT